MRILNKPKSNLYWNAFILPCPSHGIDASTLAVIFQLFQCKKLKYTKEKKKQKQKTYKKGQHKKRGPYCIGKKQKLIACHCLLSPLAFWDPYMDIWFTFGTHVFTFGFQIYTE